MKYGTVGQPNHITQSELAELVTFWRGPDNVPQDLMAVHEHIKGCDTCAEDFEAVLNDFEEYVRAPFDESQGERPAWRIPGQNS